LRIEKIEKPIVQMMQKGGGEKQRKRRKRKMYTKTLVYCSFVIILVVVIPCRAPGPFAFPCEFGAVGLSDIVRDLQHAPSALETREEVLVFGPELYKVVNG
jgi:hypothetical protein